MTYDEQYMVLLDGLRLAAATPESQISALSPFASGPSEIATSFEDGVLLLPQLVRTGYVAPGALVPLHDLYRRLEDFSRDVDDMADLAEHPFWGDIRRLAREALTCLEDGTGRSPSHRVKAIDPTEWVLRGVCAQLPELSRYTRYELGTLRSLEIIACHKGAANLWLRTLTGPVLAIHAVFLQCHGSVGIEVSLFVDDEASSLFDMVTRLHALIGADYLEIATSSDPWKYVNPSVLGVYDAALFEAPMARSGITTFPVNDSMIGWVHTSSQSSAAHQFSQVSDEYERLLENR